MKAAVLTEAGTIKIKQIAQPQIEPHELLIAIQLGGICGTDNSLFQGKNSPSFPIVPGHEAVGTIATVGASVKNFRQGQRVTIHPNYSCGECHMCRKGLSNICVSKVRVGLDIDGVFAEYIAVPESAVHAVPDTLTNEVAVFAEPLAVAAHAVNMAKISTSDRVLVFGAGVIGQLTLQLALQHTCDVTVCDLIDSRLQLAMDMGAKSTVRGEFLKESALDGYDVIFETSGAPAALELSVGLAAPAGSIVLLGIPGQNHPIPADTIVRKGLSIKGSMIYTNEIPDCLTLLDNGLINTGPLVSGIIPLEELQINLESFNDPQRIKTLVKL